MSSPHVSIDHVVMGGAPCITGTSVPVESVVIEPELAGCRSVDDQAVAVHLSDGPQRCASFGLWLRSIALGAVILLGTAGCSSRSTGDGAERPGQAELADEVDPSFIGAKRVDIDGMVGVVGLEETVLTANVSNGEIEVIEWSGPYRVRRSTIEVAGEPMFGPADAALGADSAWFSFEMCNGMPEAGDTAGYCISEDGTDISTHSEIIEVSLDDLAVSVLPSPSAELDGYTHGRIYPWGDGIIGLGGRRLATYSDGDWASSEILGSNLACADGEFAIGIDSTSSPARVMVASEADPEWRELSFTGPPTEDPGFKGGQFGFPACTYGSIYSVNSSFDRPADQNKMYSVDAESGSLTELGTLGAAAQMWTSPPGRVAIAGYSEGRGEFNENGAERQRTRLVAAGEGDPAFHRYGMEEQPLSWRNRTVHAATADFRTVWYASEDGDGYIVTVSE